MLLQWELPQQLALRVGIVFLKCFKGTNSLTDLFISIEEMFQRQKQREKGAKDQRFRISPLLKSSIFAGSKKLLSQIEDLVLSRFACQELVKEIEAAVRLSVVKCEQFSTDDVGSHDDSKHRKVPKLKCTLKYTYGDFSEDCPTKTTTIQILQQTIESFHDIIQCECMYNQRMRLPCRHGIAICIYVDIVEREAVLNCATDLGYSSALEFICTRGAHKRWISAFDEFWNSKGSTDDNYSSYVGNMNLHKTEKSHV